MAFDFIGKMGDPKLVAAALKPIADELLATSVEAIDALPKKLIDALDGMTSTTVTTIKKKENQ